MVVECQILRAAEEKQRLYPQAKRLQYSQRIASADENNIIRIKNIAPNALPSGSLLL